MVEGLEGASVPRDRICALLAAAGGGTRMGQGPKAFLRHRGRTLLEHAVAYLLESAGRVIVGLPEDRLEEGRDLVGGGQVTCLPGGATKQETVARLLPEASEPVVLVHDVSQLSPQPALMARVLAGLAGADACVPVLPNVVRGAAMLVDDEGWMACVVDRERLAFSHTPQAFRRDALQAACARAAREGWLENGVYALVQRAGGRVRTVAGDPDQIKLTFPEDLARLDPA